jgi:glycosyltransferase involved in cell wall biosynthesis
MKNNSQYPLVTAIVPVYNGSAFLKETIGSILNQTYPNVEIVAVDDGSLDNSRDIIASYGNDIRLISQKNAGVAAARNTAIKHANGDYIALLDQDDIWLPNKIGRQVEVFLKKPETVLVWGGAVRSNKGWTNDVNTSEYHLQRESYGIRGLLLHNRIDALTAIFRRDVALKLGGFDILAPPSDDWDLWIRLAASGPIAYLAETVAIHRLHDKQNSRNGYKLTLAELYVLKKHRALFGSFSDGAALYQFELGRRLTVAAMESVKVRQYNQARLLALLGIFTMKTTYWETCIKIIAESIVGTEIYDRSSAILKRLHTHHG